MCDSCQWCDIHNTCGNIKYNDTTQITGGSISCRNGNCNYSLRSGGSSSSGNFYCKGTSSTPSSVTTPSAVPLIITQITDPAVSLGMLFTDDQQKETLAVFGKKDSSGQLISVEKVTLMSNEDNSKWVTTFFGADHLPTLEFPDGSQARFSNATQTTVDITLFNSSGKLIAGPVTQAADVAKLLQLKDTLEKDGVQSGLRTICIPKWFDNIIWLIFQGISAESCATSTAVALAVPETVVPIAMALWACGSLVLGSVEKMSETSGGKTLLSPVNRYNKIAKAGFSCLSKDLKGCFLGLNKVAYSEAKNSDEATVQRDCNSADTPTKPQSNVIGENLNFGGAGCALTLNRVSVEKGQTTIKFAIDYSISSLGPDIDNPDDKWFSQVELWPNSSNCTGEHASFDHDIKDVLWNAKPNTATEQIVEISPSRTPHSVSITIPDDGSGNCSQYRWCKSLSE